MPAPTRCHTFQGPFLAARSIDAGEPFSLSHRSICVPSQPWRQLRKIFARRASRSFFRGAVPFRFMPQELSRNRRNFSSTGLQVSSLQDTPVTIRNRVVVVAGCTRGIGLEFCRQFLERNCTVFGIGRNAEQEVKDLGGRFQGRFTLIFGDVADESSIKAAARAVRDQTDVVDILINCAGIYNNAGLDTVTVDDMMRSFAVNAVGPLLVTRELLPLLERSSATRGGVNVFGPLVVNMTSKMGSNDDNTSGTCYPYRASKAALNIITKSMSIDFAQLGIFSVVLHPGWVRTAMTRNRGLIDPETSVRGLIGVMERLTPADSGSWYDWKAEVVPW